MKMYPTNIPMFSNSMTDVQDLRPGDVIALPEEDKVVKSVAPSGYNTRIIFTDGTTAKYRHSSRVPVVNGAVIRPDWRNVGRVGLKTADMCIGDFVMFDGVAAECPVQVAYIWHFSGGYTNLYFTNGKHACYSQHEWVMVLKVRNCPRQGEYDPSFTGEGTKSSVPFERMNRQLSAQKPAAPLPPITPEEEREIPAWERELLGSNQLDTYPSTKECLGGGEVA